MADFSVDVIIINWNHGNIIAACLDALQAQTCSDFTVTVVDNGSIDGSPEWLARKYPRIHLLAFSTNLGFSKAFNQAVDRTSHPYVLSLNPDVTANPGFIAEMVQAIRQDERIGIVAPKLLRANDPRLLDSTGLFVDRRRRPYDRGQGKPDDGSYDTRLDIFGACGGAALYRRAMLQDLALCIQDDGERQEYFDEDFFAYYEDADLSWRAQGRGWRAVYAPRAAAAHVRGWGDTLRRGKQRASPGARLALCNRYLMTIKNDALGYFCADLPRIILAELPRLAYAALVAPETLRGIADLIKAAPSALRKRKQIQQRRTVNAQEVRRWFYAKP